MLYKQASHELFETQMSHFLPASDLLKHLGHPKNMDFVPASQLCVLLSVLRHFSVPKPEFVTKTFGSYWFSWIIIKLAKPMKTPRRVPFLSTSEISASVSLQNAAAEALKGLREYYKFQIVDINFSKVRILKLELEAEREVGRRRRQRIQNLRKENKDLKMKLAAFDDKKIGVCSQDGKEDAVADETVVCSPAFRTLNFKRRLVFPRITPEPDQFVGSSSMFTNHIKVSFGSEEDVPEFLVACDQNRCIGGGGGIGL